MSVRIPTNELIGRIHPAWKRIRKHGVLHADWDWSELAPAHNDCFVVVDERSEPVAIWCGKHSTPLALGGNKYYRLDYLEIHPSLGGLALGAALLILISVRALEVGADGIVLAALPVDRVREFYRDRGATEGAPAGWSFDPELIPFTFDRAALQRMREIADELRQSET